MLPPLDANPCSYRLTGLGTGAPGVQRKRAGGRVPVGSVLVACVSFMSVSIPIARYNYAKKRTCKSITTSLSTLEAGQLLVGASWVFGCRVRMHKAG